MAPPPVAAVTDAPKAPTIEYADFEKLELRVGKVLSAIAVPKKDKLLHLQVDLGEAKPRSIVAGIAQAYKPDQLVGKQVIVVTNLAPRKLAGLVSEGMILASGDGAEINGLSGVDRDVPPGTRVR
jgi:methionyl-tRNA synthetase